MIVYIQWIIIRKVGHCIISKTIAAKILRISIQYNLIAACWYEEAIIGITSRGREIEHKYKVATHEAEYLIAIVVPDFHDRSILEILHTLDDLEHLSVKIA